MATRPGTLDATWHGHRLGFTYVTREALAAGQDLRRLARAIAYDFAIFDGFACLCPQAVLVEDGGAPAAAELAPVLAEGMAGRGGEAPAPPAALPPAARATN